MVTELPERRSDIPSSAGLTSDEAKRRLVGSGANAIADARPSPWRRVLSKFWAPVPCLLEIAILLQLALREYVEAAVICVLLVFNAGLGVLQEVRAQATLDALKSRLALLAKVRRDGSWTSVPASELVPGDVVNLSLGSVIGADVRLLEGSILVDQSTLTGESLPIECRPGQETYAGALVRRGEAVAVVVATGAGTKFGRSAELVRTAHVASSQQKAVLHVVRNLAIFNSFIIAIQVIYATTLKLPVGEIIPLTLTAILAAIPVALPATFTLASALAARALAKRGVLPTRLSAIDEAATMDVLCADKTGTLTQNDLAVAVVHAMPGSNVAQVLSLAALASSEGGEDPVDAAIRAASARTPAAGAPKLDRFIPFDPANKMSEAVTVDAQGGVLRIVKGAFATIAGQAAASSAAAASAGDLEAQGLRVLAVASGPPTSLQLAGLIGLSDPPRADSAALIADLSAMGIRTVMVTGDAPATAAVVAHAVGLTGAIHTPESQTQGIRAEDFAVFAGVFPEDKFNIVTALQKDGHTVGMCGDGANDAPALRQAQMGIAVSTATDVAKSAAGIVLTEPGLGGVVAAVREGRITFQRILTYTLRSLTRKIDQLLFLTVGLAITGHAILTPLLMIILMITGDFLSMSASTDNVRPTSKPNAWQIDQLTLAGAALGGCNLIFCSGVLAVGKFGLGLDIQGLQTLAVVTLAFSGQGVLYAVRERRRLWASRPSLWLMASSVADVLIIGAMAASGVLMTRLSAPVIAGVLIGALAFAFLLDEVKVRVFARLGMS